MKASSAMPVSALLQVDASSGGWRLQRSCQPEVVEADKALQMSTFMCLWVCLFLIEICYDKYLIKCTAIVVEIRGRTGLNSEF